MPDRDSTVRASSIPEDGEKARDYSQRITEDWLSAQGHAFVQMQLGSGDSELGRYIVEQVTAHQTTLASTMASAEATEAQDRNTIALGALTKATKDASSDSTRWAKVLAALTASLILVAGTQAFLFAAAEWNWFGGEATVEIVDNE